MSIDRSLKSASTLARHRNVLSRAERIARMAQANKFDMTSDNPLGLAKTANRKLVTGSKTKKAKETEADAS